MDEPYTCASHRKDFNEVRRLRRTFYNENKSAITFACALDPNSAQRPGSALHRFNELCEELPEPQKSRLLQHESACADCRRHRQNFDLFW